MVGKELVRAEWIFDKVNQSGFLGQILQKTTEL